jgi:alpha-tubulin suppressor-like RCC1 family protein
MKEIVSAWGDNSNGQLGDGSSMARQHPQAVPDLDRVHTIKAGSGHVVAQLDDGTALAWGRNAFGQLGDGSTDNQPVPTPVKGLDRIVSIVPSGGGTLFLRDDGTVWGCGGGFFGLLGETNPALHPVPVQVEGIAEVTDLVCGGSHALALRADGTVWSWGRDDYGQLGDGPDPGSVPGREQREHAGRGYECRARPARVRDLTGVRALAAGGGHSVAVLDDGSMVSWGDNDRGQLGDGTTNHRPSPGPVEGLTAVRAAVCAYHHTLALHTDGTVMAFGINDCGQLGDGTRLHRYRPVRVRELERIEAIAAAGGGGEANPGNYGHSVALRSDGTVWTWGCNTVGELGSAAAGPRLVPAPVAGIGGARQVTCGGEIPFSRENPGGGYTLALHRANAA